MKRLAFLLLVLCLVGPHVFAVTFEDEHPHDRDRFAAFRLWFPDNLKKARILVVLLPGFNSDGRGLADDPAWQTFAQAHDAALLGCFFQGHESGTYQWQSIWSGKAFETSLTRLAKQSQHPEIATAPIIMWGHSAGGQFTYNFACWKPQRVLAFGVCKGGHNFQEAGSETVRIPALLIAGEHDEPERLANLTGIFSEGRRKGAPWCLAIEYGAGHDLGTAPDLARSFFTGVLRLNDAGDLNTGALEGDLTTHQFSASTEHPPGRITSWLPDEETAVRWKQFVEKGMRHSAP